MQVSGRYVSIVTYKICARFKEVVFTTKNVKAARTFLDETLLVEAPFLLQLRPQQKEFANTFDA